MEGIKISVIIPVYNSRELIRECLLSVIRQTLGEIEILCVDDGSTDDTMEMIGELSARDGRIHCIRLEHQGAGEARNAGIDQARGEYVAFLDSDDFYMDNDSLKIMYETAGREQAVICGAYRSRYLSGATCPNELHREACKDYPEGRRLKYRDYQYDFHFHSYIYKKSFLVSGGLRFPSYSRYEDPVFFVKAMILAGEFYVVPVEMYCYREKDYEIHYNTIQLHDTLCGMRDVLKIALGYDLVLLHNRTVARLEHEYPVMFQDNPTADFVEAIWELTDAVNFEWLKKNRWDLAYIKYMVNAACRYNTLTHDKVWPFPYAQIPRQSRVALYGAGDVGQDYYAQLTQTGYCSVCLWVDRAYAAYRELGLTVQPVEAVRNEEFDYMVIAVSEERTIKIIKENLMAMGISSAKLVCMNRSRQKIYLNS